jgi:signal transduction histidine kinase
VQNVLRHAGAWAKAEVSLSCSDSRLVFAIVDNGVGFDVAEQGRGVGQRSMRQRISAINGTFVVDSRPGHGTRIRGVVPLDAGAGAH